jgi:tellurium resistance protein TerZ
MSINLEKGSKINLSKEDGTSLDKIFVALGWKEKSSFFGSSDAIDLDAGLVMFKADGSVFDTVYFRHKDSKCGSIKHSGDNLTGIGEGDDEVIRIELSKIPEDVTTLVFSINSYSGHKFGKIDKCFTRVVDSTNNNEFCHYQLSDKGNSTGLVVAKVYRHNGAWKFNAIGDTLDGKIITDVTNDLKRYI